MSDGSFQSHPGFRTPSESPSDLARSPRFNTWALGAHIFHAHDPSPESKKILEELCEFKLPRSFLRKPHASSLRTDHLFYAELNHWATSNPTLVVDEDIHRICAHSQILSHAFFSLSSSLERKSKEAGQRRAVDAITELAFDSEDTSIHHVVLEADLCLPVSAVQTVNVTPNARPDTLVVLPLSASLHDRIFLGISAMVDSQDLPIVHGSAYWSKDTEGDNSIIAFPCEYKRDEGMLNKNQLVMDFGAAQCQRQALGLPSQIIWGATCSKGQFDVFSSEWVDNYISYSSHHIWNLHKPVEFVKCYSFLRSLAITTATLQQELEGMDANAIAKSVVSASWRAPTPPTGAASNKRQRSDIDGARVPRARGTNSDEVDDLDPEESNQWHESVKNWQFERERPGVEPSTFGLPLKQHLLNLPSTLIYDMEHGLTSVVDEWSTNVS